MSLKDLLKKRVKTGLQNANELKDIERFRTGIAGLDCLLGGGLPKGRIVQIWGPESVGKSSLCLSIIKGLLDADKEAEALYVDAERTVHKGDIEVQGIDGDRLVFCSDAFGGEESIDVALDALQAGADIAVIDSVPYLRPVKVLTEIEKDSSYRDVSSIALLMERVQHKIVKTVQNTESTLIFINQQRPPKGMYEAPSYPGGSALSFMLSCSIHISSASKDRDNPAFITQNVTIRKNKTFTPMLKGEIPVLNRVVQRGQSLLSSCIKHDIINMRGGGHIYLDEKLAKQLGREEKLGRGIENISRMLEADNALYSQLYDLLIFKACERQYADQQVEDSVEYEEGLDVGTI